LNLGVLQLLLEH